MEERPAIWKAAVKNILNKQLRTADKRLSFSFEGRARCSQILVLKTYRATDHAQRKPRTWVDHFDRGRWRALMNAVMNLRVT